MSAPEDESAEDPLPEADLWLVDGFNVLHAVMLGGESRSCFWTRDARDRLVARLAGGRDAGEGPAVAGEIVLVFDGPHPVEGDAARPAPGLELVFAPSADDWIVRRVRGADRPERVAVVSHDRQVAGRARHAGARVVAPATFLGAFPDGRERADGADDAPGD